MTTQVVSAHTRHPAATNASDGQKTGAVAPGSSRGRRPRQRTSSSRHRHRHRQEPRRRRQPPLPPPALEAMWAIVGEDSSAGMDGAMHFAPQEEYAQGRRRTAKCDGGGVAGLACVLALGSAITARPIIHPPTGIRLCAVQGLFLHIAEARGRHLASPQQPCPAPIHPGAHCD